MDNKENHFADANKMVEIPVDVWMKIKGCRPRWTPLVGRRTRLLLTPPEAGNEQGLTKEKEMYKAKDVAAYIINKQVDDGCPISNLKLQKILYFVQAEFLVSKDEPCFDDIIEAWDFGPVIESVYNVYAVNGGNLIFSPSESTSGYYIKHNDRELIDGILDKVKKYSTSYLADIIHHQTPWIKGRTRLNRIITNEGLEDFFAK